MIKIKLEFIVCSFVLLFNSSAVVMSQTLSSSRYLTVELSPQKQEYWCWAASAEMVVRFNNRLPAASGNQCNLAQNWINGIEGEHCVDCSCTKSISCNMPVSGIESLRDLFLQNRFTSSMITPTWNYLMKQIKNKKLPFIVIKQYRSDVEDCTPSHILVAKGYEVYKQKIEGIDVESRYLVINDPQSNTNCQGFVDTILYGIYPNSNQNEYTLCSFLTDIVYNRNMIVPRMLQISKPKLFRLADTIPIILSPSARGKSLKGIYSKDNFLNLINTDEKNTVIPIRYIQMDKILIADSSKLNIEEIYYKTEPIYELIYENPNTANQYTVNRMQLGQYNWKTHSVSNQFNAVLSPQDSNEFKLDNKKIDWVSNVKTIYNGEVSKLPQGAYEKIIFPPFNHEFFHFYNNGRSFYTPLSDYPNLQVNAKPILKNKYYDEKDILKALQTKAKLYNEKFRKK